MKTLHVPGLALVVAILVSASASSAATVDAVTCTAAARGLVQRLLPKAAGQFEVEALASEQGHDVFEIESREGKVVLRGNTGVAIASALNQYLKDYCRCDLSWHCGNQLTLPKALPAVPQKVRVVSPHKFRYCYNYCTHGYTMAWWDWPQWEEELDFQAMSGMNLLLIIQGQEQVWINTLKEFGYSEADIRKFLVMPSHQPWMYMSNLEGYGGPVPQEVIDRRLALGRKILARMRELGMEPVLQGYYGIVPADFKTRFPHAKTHEQGLWCGLQRPDMLDPLDPLFAKVATAFYREQTKLLGVAHYYAGDPFHEGGKLTGIDLAACGRAIYGPMQGATWVLQSWEANPRQAMIDGLDKDKLLVLDLWCDAQENWRARSNFNGTPWVWCTVQTFGGNSGIGGRLAWVGQQPARVLEDANKGRYSGIGAVLEGGATSPAVWEIFFENAWRSQPPEMEVWLKDYARRRYGAAIPAAEQAWKLLASTLYNAPVSKLQFPINSAICARPSLQPDQRARRFVPTQPFYEPTNVIEVWKLMLEAAPQAKRSDGYRYDLVDISRQGLADLGTRYHQQIARAYQAKDAKALHGLSEKMLGLLRDLDQLMGTRREFLLGPWLRDARNWGATEEQQNLCERNARELLTVWTAHDSITDYANRQYNGLLGHFYYHRWEMWLGALNESLARGSDIDETAVRGQIRDWELAWTRGHEQFPTEPRGDAVALSRKFFAKYSPDTLQPMK